MKTIKLGRTSKGAHRVWLEGQQLTDAGFVHGTRYRREIGPFGILWLSVDVNGKYRVSGSAARPVIDLAGTWLGDWARDSSTVDVSIQADSIAIVSEKGHD